MLKFTEHFRKLTEADTAAVQSAKQQEAVMERQTLDKQIAAAQAQIKEHQASITTLQKKIQELNAAKSQAGKPSPNVT